MNVSLMQLNANQGISTYITNTRNGFNRSTVPQGLLGPVVPLDASSAPGASLEIPLSVPISRATLASALASASPENQRMVSPYSWAFSSHIIITLFLYLTSFM